MLDLRLRLDYKKPQYHNVLEDFHLFNHKKKTFKQFPIKIIKFQINHK